MTTVFDIRRHNLLLLIADSYQNNRAEFCRSTGKNPNLINLVLSSNAEYRRNIGEKLARDIERRAGIAQGWLDSPGGIGERNVARISILAGSRAIPDVAPVTSDFSMTLPVEAPTLALRVTGIANLVIVSVDEPSMAPTFSIGDYVWLDLGVKKFDRDGVYAFRIHDGATALRRIQRLPNGDLRVSTDDPVYAPQIYPDGDPSDLRIVGKAVGCIRQIPL
jgi:Peptidase S24-like